MMMPHRNYGSFKTARQEREEFEAEERKRLGKNERGGTGFKMSQEKRNKNRKKRKR